MMSVRSVAARPAGKAPPLLAVENLSTHFGAGAARAVDDVSFTLGTGEVLGIVGESGCGKSVTAMSILRLVDAAPGIVGGAIRLDGENLLQFDDAAIRRVRGGQIGMIFQEPMTSLNPVLSIGRQLVETIRLDGNLSKQAARERAVDLLRLVRIADADRRLGDYPHQFSGGMRQRVMIALAIARSPRILIADEPTTALDVTVQAQILDLLLDLRDRLGMAIILITHDLGVVAETCDRALVMYAGRIVEDAAVDDLFARPMHPYTRGLMRAVPRLDMESAGGRLQEIPGMVPAPGTVLPGCRFEPRCAFAVEQCRAAYPKLEPVAPAHRAACWRAGETGHG